MIIITTIIATVAGEVHTIIPLSIVTVIGDHHFMVIHLGIAHIIAGDTTITTTIGDILTTVATTATMVMADIMVIIHITTTTHITEIIHTGTVETQGETMHLQL